jgi:hypothetical protein
MQLPFLFKGEKSISLKKKVVVVVVEEEEEEEKTAQFLIQLRY